MINNLNQEFLYNYTDTEDEEDTTVDSFGLPQIHVNLVSSSIIHHTPTAYFIIKDKPYLILLDTGCDPYSCIYLSLCRSLNLTIIPQPGILKFADGSTKPRIGITEPVTFILIFVGGEDSLPKKEFTMQFEILDDVNKNTNTPFIVGNNILRLYKEGLNASQCTSLLSVLISNRSSSFIHVNNISISDENSDNILPEDDLEPVRPRIESSTIEEELYSKEREKILTDCEIMEEWNKNESIHGGISHSDAIVILKFKEGTDFNKLSRHQYPIPQQSHVFVDRATDSWHAEGIDEPVPTNAGLIINCPLLPVPKVSGGLVIENEKRICVDPRSPNEKWLNMDSFPLPNIRHQLESLRGKKFFAELDLENCFFQFPIHPDTRFIAYTWRGIQYRFNRTPFGFTFMTSHVQRFMSSLFKDMEFVLIYVDNIFISSEDEHQHRIHILQVLRRCNQWNIKLKRKSFTILQLRMYTFGSHCN